MASELVIRVRRDDEGRNPQVTVEADGKQVGVLSRLLFVADTQRPVPLIEVEILRGFLLRQDLTDESLQMLEEAEELLKKHHVDVKAPV